MAIDVSIIILNYNTKKMTSECIESVYKYTRNVSFEIFLIDNSSTDGSQQFLSKFKKHDNFKLISNTKNLGFGVANNQGIKLSKGKFILLLNSDTLLREDSVTKIYEFMKLDTKCGIASCSLKNVDNSNQSNGGYFPTLVRVFMWMTFLDDLPVLGSIIRSFHPKPMHTAKSVETDWVMGSFFMIRREVLDKVGLFDEDYFMYTEEVDFCFRAKKEGFNIWFVPFTSIIHYGGASSSSEFAIINEFKGIVMFYSKHTRRLSQIALRTILFIGISLRILIYTLPNPRKAKVYGKSLRYIA